MAHVNDKIGQLRQNLVDAGCNEQMVKRCLDLIQSQQQGQLRQTLNQHRRALLDNLHREQKHIDCLDYLLYRLEH